MFLELHNITKAFDGKTAVDDVSLSLDRGELLCVLGASGCGKTTLLNIIGGFLTPDRGSVTLDGRDITRDAPRIRPVTTVFQSYGLFPHMSAIQNVVYGLKFRGYTKKQAREKGFKYLAMVGLADRAEARIHELSGGQQQRVALARALIVEPKLCLLDEPFCNLDAGLRGKMRAELKKIQRELGMTMVFVTHDQEEAIVLADRIAVMDAGRLRQFDTPRNLCLHPADDFVAEFLGLSCLDWREDGTLIKTIRLE